MDQQKIDMFIMTNQKYFPAEKIVYLKDKLRAMDEDKFSEFVLNNIILSALKKEEPRILKALVFNYIKVKQ